MKNIKIFILFLFSLTLIGCNTSTPSIPEEYSEGLTFNLINNGREYEVLCTQLGVKEIIIPSTFNGKPVTSIGESAFLECNRLSSITIPNSVISIENWAFYGCASLTSVTIPDSVISIGSESFSYCSNLKSVIIPNNITSINYSAFIHCESLIYNKSNGLNYLGNNDNPYLLLERVDDETLTSYQIHNTTKIINSNAFEDCENFTSINVDSTNQYYSSIDGVLFNKNQTALICCPIGKIGSYTIPDGVTSIGIFAFEECKNLTSITIPNSVISIGNHVFSYCKNLIYNKSNGISYLGNDDNPYFLLVEVNASYQTSHQIHNTTKLIYFSSFKGCSLTSITIPSSVTFIGDYAFLDCIQLVSINVDNKNEYYSSVDGVLFNKNQTKLILYPIKKVGGYTIPSKVISVENFAFLDCGSLTSVTVPNSVVSIGYQTFKGCDNLTSINIPNSIISIGVRTFLGCNNLTSINIDSKNQNYSSIDGILFNKKRAVLICYPAGKEGNYIIPNSVTSIQVSAFEGCTNLTSVTIPNSVTSIEWVAFEGCNNLTTIYVKGYTSLPDGWDSNWLGNCSAEIIWNN